MSHNDYGNSNNHSNNHSNDYDFEKSYWGNCCNTFDEEQKQFVYGKLMGLHRTHYSFDVSGKRILDIGGGPSSLLLKTINLTEGKVVDPIAYPQWTVDRYASNNISVSVSLGENIQDVGWDEVWMYNCLQHTVDPSKIIHNALKAAPVFRIFEWIDIPAHDGHPHELTEDALNGWIGQPGCVTTLAESGCYGRAYYGVFTPVAI
jgi:hypothetical protein